MTDRPSMPAKPTDEQLDQAREQHAADAEQAERDDKEASTAESQHIWDEMHEARDRAEEMGDRVEDGTTQSGTGGRDAEE
jgi:hypothetical protein